MKLFTTRDTLVYSIEYACGKYALGSISDDSCIMFSFRPAQNFTVFVVVVQNLCFQGSDLCLRWDIMKIFKMLCEARERLEDFDNKFKIFLW